MVLAEQPMQMVQAGPFARELIERASAEADARRLAAEQSRRDEIVTAFATRLFDLLGAVVEARDILVLPGGKDTRYEPQAIYVLGSLRFAYHVHDEPLRVQYCCPRCLVMAHERGRACRDVADIGDEIAQHRCPDLQAAGGMS